MSKLDSFTAIVRNDFHIFTQRVFASLNPGKQYLDNWHFQAMCYALYQCWRGDITRLIITVPPRYGKSMCGSIALPAFALGHDPTQRIIVVSYGSNLSTELSNAGRGLLKEAWFRSAFPGTIVDPDKDTEGLVKTTQGGYRYATTIGGQVTGLGGDILIIDDPMKASIYPSENDLQTVIDYYNGALYSRLDNKKTGRIIVIMQRIHENDLVGYLLQQEGWHHVNLPAIAIEDDEIDISDEEYYPREAGEPLHEARESLEDLQTVKEQMGPYAFSAQYQQSPIPREGGLIEWEWFKFYDLLPNNGKGGYMVQSWDTAMSLHASSSYSVCTTWFCYQENYYLVNVWRGRLKSPALYAKIQQEALAHRADLVIIEHHNGSEALIEMLLKHSRLNLFWIKPAHSKEQRMIGECPVIDGGRVFLPKQAKWMQAFRNEMIRFPSGKHDDQVDSVSQFLYWARVRGPDWPNGGGRRGLGHPNGPMGPSLDSGGSSSQSIVTSIYSEPPPLDLSELYE